MDQQGQPPADHTTPDGEMAQGQDRVERESPPPPSADYIPPVSPPVAQFHQDIQPQHQVYGQPQQPPYQSPGGFGQGDYSPPPQSHMGGDYRPDNQAMYGQPPQQSGSGDYYPPQQQPQQYYTGGPPYTYPAPPKKKGLPTWAWVAPLIAVLLVAGGLGTWAYVSAQEKAAADARATSTAIAQGYATSTAQARGTSTAVARATSTAIAGETATAAAQISGSGNAELLKIATTNMKTIKSYHLVVSGKTGDQDVQMEGDLDIGNNKSKLNVVAQGQNVSAISIGSDSYISLDGGTTYIKSPTSMADSLATFTKLWDNFKAEDIDKVKDALKDGTPKEEKVGSDDTRHMTGSTKDLGSLSAAGGSGTNEGTVDIWVTTGDKPTVRKMSVVGKDSSGNDINATIEWSNIDQAITIEAPPTIP